MIKENLILNMHINKLYIVIIFFAFIPRLIIISLFPETGGDYEVYSTVAKNILNGCGVSLSNPDDNQCMAHFGGNHGPGYPFFLSIVWYIFGENDFIVRLMQTIIYTACTLWIVRASFILTNKRNKALWIGIAFSLSPLLLAWPRYLQTETLSLAFTILVLAELILSIAKKKLRIIGLSLSLILATWIRLDNIFLTIPVAIVSFYVHGFKIGILRGFLIAVLLSSTWMAWTVRNIVVDLPTLIPTDMTIHDGSRSPTGYLSWTKTWITHEYERPGALWGVNRKNYKNIFIPERAYKDKIEKQKVSALIENLKNYDQKEFPLEIDNSFRDMAAKKIKEYPFEYWIINPLIRSYRIWSNPFSSFGWPNEIPHSGLTEQERLLAAKGNLYIIIQKVKAHPIQAFSKGLNAFYRTLLMILLLTCLYYAFKSKKANISRLLGLISFSYILTRTIFASINGNIETRYLLTTIPFIELFIIMILYDLLKKKLLI